MNQDAKLPSDELLTRLSKGEKFKISKKEMKKRTKKNYNRLSEVQKRKEKEQKAKALKTRL